MPYLPPDVLDPAAYSCALVFYPTQDEYAAALLGQIAELSDAWNWETDRASQATIRQVWLEAERQTLECWNMACLDDIIALLEDIRDHEWCCDTIDNVPGGDEINGVDDSTLPPDVDRDGESLPPEYEGDPEAYDAYLCGQANRIADTTDEAVNAVHNAILAASNVLVFATLVVLAFSNVIGMGIAAILAGGYTLVTIGDVLVYFDAFTELRAVLGGGDPQGLVAQTQGEMASIHDDIVQVIFCANDAGEASSGLASLVDGVVTNGSYAALLKLTYFMAMRPIFWGFGGANDDESCVCMGTPLGAWDWGTDDNGWDGWTQQGATLAGNAMVRGPYGTMAEIGFVADPEDTEVEVTILASRNNSAGEMDVGITIKESGSVLVGETVSVSGTGVVEATASEHTVILDISGRSQANLALGFNKSGGSTGYTVLIYSGFAHRR